MRLALVRVPASPCVHLRLGNLGIGMVCRKAVDTALDLLTDLSGELPRAHLARRVQLPQACLP